MSSSSFYELRLDAAAEDGVRRLVVHKLVDGLALPWRDENCHEIRHDEALTIDVSRSSADCALRGLLCNEMIFEVPVGRKRIRLSDNTWFLHELGESTFIVEERDDEEEAFHPIIEVNLRIIPSPETLHQYKVMAEDLVQVHAGLARDVVSRAVVRRSAIDSPAVHELQPEPILAQLRELHGALRDALATIGRHPGSALQTVTRFDAYRPGDRPGTSALFGLLLSPGTLVSARGRPERLGKALMTKPVLTTDLEEHRHIAARLLVLAGLGDTVARHCRQTAALLRHERHRWGNAPREDEVSVFESTYLPRIELLEKLAAEAKAAAAAFRELRWKYPFLRHAGRPGTHLGPTPLFVERPGYREAYAVLRRVRDLSGLLVDSESIRLHYRSLASMFEYWCFVKTINWLRERYGAPEPRDSFSVVGAVYRPTLEPGQFFLFRVTDTHTLRVTYEPSILPWRQARAQGCLYGATLTANPLRPDILVEFLHADYVVAAMVLDAKATTRFAMQRIREMSDYARQIFEVASGRQPVRRVFILHRDSESDYLSNLPPRRPHALPPSTEIFGAAACVPEKVNTVPAHIGRLLRSFIRCCLAWSPDAAPSEGTAATEHAGAGAAPAPPFATLPEEATTSGTARVDSDPNLEGPDTGPDDKGT
ncbi:MAG: hypothetical protein JXR77_07155 [Lentisphaeria bacterium]|nr:hypothetical protein [Lentisphaeria bacterium]